MLEGSPFQPVINAYQVITQADWDAMSQAEKNQTTFISPCNRNNIASQSKCKVIIRDAIIQTKDYKIQISGQNDDATLTAVRGEGDNPRADADF